MSTNDQIFLEFSTNKLEQLASRIEDCLGRLSDEQVWTRHSENENSAGNLVLHLCGNLRQWIGTGVAGMPNVRDRDAEFAARGGLSREQLRARLSDTVREAGKAIRATPAERLSETINVQGYEVTVLEAIYHVVEHFAQHTGQIIFLTKLLTGRDLGYYGHLSQQHTETTP
ncbi:MAG: DinB family protein [Bryobacteraceae bacterium]